MARRGVARPTPLRGQVWWVEYPRLGRKPMLIVSNNRRNEVLPSVLAVRITTAPKPSLPTIVELGKDDGVRGRVMCDDVTVVPTSLLKARAGAASRATMAAVATGLRAALDL
ncbi:MAG TPA: type II toxin-antitoxin system PemK/MazF family toxin [Actinomycetota bacterium]